MGWKEERKKDWMPDYFMKNNILYAWLSQNQGWENSPKEKNETVKDGATLVCVSCRKMLTNLLCIFLSISSLQWERLINKSLLFSYTETGESLSAYYLTAFLILEVTMCISLSLKFARKSLTWPSVEWNKAEAQVPAREMESKHHLHCQG